MVNWETEISKTSREKTLEMRIGHLLTELHIMVRALRADARVSGTQTRRYYEFFAKQLENRLKTLQDELQSINYLEVD